MSKDKMAICSLPIQFLIITIITTYLVGCSSHEVSTEWCGDIMEMRDTIKLSYERACKEGLFIADTQWARRARHTGSEKDIHSVVFSAYDGFHLGWYFNTRKEADKACSEINALHSVELVDKYFEKLREEFRAKK